MNLDLESLRCFEAAATELHFTRAARRVALSLSAFSERIRRLEQTLGAELFERSTRHVVLTDAGNRLLPQAQACLRAAEGCHVVLHGSELARAHTLVIGTRFELGMSWLVPSLHLLEEHLPELDLHLVFGDSVQLVGFLIDGRVDAAITSARISHPRLTTTTLHEEHYRFVAAPSLLARSPFGEPSHAKGHTLLDIDASLPLYRYLSEAHEDAPRGFVRQQSLGTIAAVRHRVLEGAGVAVLPLYFIEQELREGRVVELLPTLTLATDWFRLIWRAGHPLTRPIERLAAALRGYPLR